MVLWNHQPLVEKFCHIYNQDVITACKHVDNLLLCWQQVKIRFCQLIKASGINDWTTLGRLTWLAVAVDDEDWVSTRGVIDSIGEASLFIELVKYPVNDFTVSGT